MRTGTDETLNAIVRELVPSVADGCTIDLHDRSGPLCVAACHLDSVAEHALSDASPGARAAFVACGRAAIVVAGNVVGDLVTWGSRPMTPLAEIAVRAAAGHAGAVIEARAAERRAKGAEAGRTSIVAMVGHEVRAPLQALTVGLELMEMRLRSGTAPSEWLLDRCTKLSRSLQRLGGVAQRLLDVSRLEVGVSPTNSAPQELGAIVREVLERVRADADWVDCVIRVEQDAPLDGRWDSTHLETVLENLLTNAMKYGAGRPIDIALHGDAHDVTVTVRDHGCGIEADDVGRVFDQFFRGRVDGHYPGLGVGLWIVERLVVAHGGTISCESERGHGTTFVVTLPRDVTRADRVQGSREALREEPRH